MEIMDRVKEKTTCTGRMRFKKIGKLNRTGMEDGNNGLFESAREKLTEALQEVRQNMNPVYLGPVAEKRLLLNGIHRSYGNRNYIFQKSLSSLLIPKRDIHSINIK